MGNLIILLSLISLKKKFSIIGSAHNLKEIKIKETIENSKPSSLEKSVIEKIK